MFTRDPYDIPTPRDATPQKPDFRQEFYRQLPDMRPTRGREAQVTFACRFNTQTKQVLHVRGFCPHFEGEDAR